MTTDRFFSVDADGDFNTHATADEALTSVINAIDWLRDNSDGIDEDEIARCMWGVVLGRGATTITQTIEQATTDGDEAAIDLMRRRGWDYLVECGAETDCPALRDVIASREEMREHPAADDHDDTLPPGHWVDVVANLLCLDSPGKHPRSRLVVCAAMLVREVERLDRAAATTPTPPTPGEE